MIVHFAVHCTNKIKAFAKGDNKKILRANEISQFPNIVIYCSSVHLSNCIIEEDYFPIDDRPPSTLGVKLIPIKTQRSVSVDSFSGSEPLPSITDKITSPLTSPLASLRLPTIGSLTQPSVRSFYFI
jgi:hypothetical protein